MDRLHSGDENVAVRNKYSKKLERSGYSSNTRADVIKASIHTYRRMRTEEAAGKSPLYRPRSWHEIRQSLEKESKRSTCSKNEKKGRGSGWSSAHNLPTGWRLTN